MFNGKSVTIAKVKPIVKTQKIIVDENVVDVNVSTRSKVTGEHVFKDKDPRKSKSVAD
jgi:hypothetical protein